MKGEIDEGDGYAAKVLKTEEATPELMRELDSAMREALKQIALYLERGEPFDYERDMHSLAPVLSTVSQISVILLGQLIIEAVQQMQRDKVDGKAFAQTLDGLLNNQARTVLTPYVTSIYNLQGGQLETGLKFVENELNHRLQKTIGEAIKKIKQARQHKHGSSDDEPF